MPKKGVLFTCARCKREEFVYHKDVEKTDWRPIVLNPANSSDTVEICPSCSKLFDEMYKIFVSSHACGVLCYTSDGRPVIFDPDALVYREPAKNEKMINEEVVNEEMSKSLKIKGNARITYVALTRDDIVELKEDEGNE